MILAIKTDQPQAELYILADNGTIKQKHTYQADRQLAATLLGEIQTFLAEHDLAFNNLSGIVYFSGSGSFTGLRIGASVANTLAYSLGVKVAKTAGKDWLENAASELAAASIGSYPAPDYDKKPNIS